MYLLATLIKIPIVLIYNHATLSKKLSIAGLFQSSFPQFIQLMVLLFTFYFFISSWQADQLRNIITSKIQSVLENKNSEGISFYTFPEISDKAQIYIAGDGGNDLPVFNKAHRSYCPGSSSNEIKLNADVIIDREDVGVLTPMLQDAGYL